MFRRFTLSTTLTAVLIFSVGLSSNASAVSDSPAPAPKSAGVSITVTPPVVKAYPPPPSAPPSPVPVIYPGATITPPCLSCPKNWDDKNSTTPNSHNPVAYNESGTLVDTHTGRPAYFGPDGQAARGGPASGMLPYVMPDGRVAYYVPITPTPPPPVWFPPAMPWPVFTHMPVAIVPLVPPIEVSPT